MAKGSTSTGHFLLRPDRALHQEPRYETVAKHKVSLTQPGDGTGTALRRKWDEAGFI